MDASAPDCHETYAMLMRAHGDDESRVFVALVMPILERFAGQMDLAPLGDARLEALASGLWTALGEAGWSSSGGPGIAASRLESIVVGAMASLPAADAGEAWSNAVRQIVKALTYPELTECRLSYAEVDAKGVCRRQTASIARARVSGAHCVDCPYWTSLRAENHRVVLAASWLPASDSPLGGAEAVFLPDDFRRLRHWLWSARRRSGSSVIV